MANKNITPWRRKRQELDRPSRDPFMALQSEMNRLFDDFMDRPFGLMPRMAGFDDEFWPNIDVYETDKEIKLTAELPGMDEKDIDISINNNILTISGKKESDKVDEQSSYYRRERSYGEFQRSIQLPGEVDIDKIDATYDKGILTLTVPKPAESVTTAKKIAVKKA
jgi:HSP20 family protein